MSRGRRISRLKLNPPSSEAAYKYLSSWNGKQLFHDPSNFPPLSPESFSFPPKPFSIDIGCGSGEYLCNLAASQPDENFLGIEISRRSIYQAVNQAANFNLENIHFLK
ncbi:MAG: methyltransferase domain-containing protein, partial [Anaerolineae bacterium]|nr:methyltransferase domain-containing protein [Anaerolineae bacterium]